MTNQLYRVQTIDFWIVPVLPLCLSIFNIGKALQKRSGETLSIVLLISQGKQFLTKIWSRYKSLGWSFSELSLAGWFGMGLYAGATISVSETETRDSQKQTGDRPNGHAFWCKIYCL